MRNLIKRIIKEEINRSFGSMNDLSSYRDINLDSPSSLSKARSSQGLKVSNVMDSKKNIPFNDKISRIYTIMLRYIGKKFKLNANSSDLRERGKELSNFIKNFLTRDEIENFYYRLTRFNSNTAQFKRICEQLLNYMETGQMSNIDVYDNVDMGDEDERDAYRISPYAMLEDRMERLRNKMKPIKQKISLIKSILYKFPVRGSKYKPFDKNEFNFAVSNGFIDADEFRKKVSSSKTGGVNRERDVFLSMLNTSLQDYNDDLRYLEQRFVEVYNELKK